MQGQNPIQVFDVHRFGRAKTIGAIPSIGIVEEAVKSVTQMVLALMPTSLPYPGIMVNDRQPPCGQLLLRAWRNGWQIQQPQGHTAKHHILILARSVGTQ